MSIATTLTPPASKPAARVLSVAPIGELDGRLAVHLDYPDGQEELTFALYRWARGKNRDTVLLVELVLPKDGERFVRGKTSFTGSNFLPAARVAAARDCGPALLHTHIGAGSVAQHVAEGLARNGFTDITVMDFDAVEQHNLDRLLPATVADIGTAKVTVLAGAHPGCSRRHVHGDAVGVLGRGERRLAGRPRLRRAVLQRGSALAAVRTQRRRLCPPHTRDRRRRRHRHPRRR